MPGMVQNKKVEIYNLDYDEKGEPAYFLFNTVTESNKEELKIVHFPYIKMDFDELLNIEW